MSDRLLVAVNRQSENIDEEQYEVTSNVLAKYNIKVAKDLNKKST
jgi:hypothetical protein